jgi:hypothetical protein
VGNGDACRDFTAFLMLISANAVCEALAAAGHFREFDPVPNDRQYPYKERKCCRLRQTAIVKNGAGELGNILIWKRNVVVSSRQQA